MTKTSPSDPVEESASIKDLTKHPERVPKPSTQRPSADPRKKATQFDGNPQPQATDKTATGPRDDTPAFLEKRNAKKQ